MVPGRAWPAWDYEFQTAASWENHTGKEHREHLREEKQQDRCRYQIPDYVLYARWPLAIFAGLFHAHTLAGDCDRNMEEIRIFVEES